MNIREVFIQSISKFFNIEKVTGILKGTGGATAGR